MATYKESSIRKCDAIKGVKDLAEFFVLCKKIGIYTLEDIALFIKLEVRQGYTLIEEMKRYARELDD